MSFSKRYGFDPQKTIQSRSMDEALRNRLYNLLNSIYPKRPGYFSEYDFMREFVLDKMGIITNSRQDENNFAELFLNGAWYKRYDMLEYCLMFIADRDSNEYPHEQKLKAFSDEIMTILEAEKAGYRLLSNQFVPITNQNELEAIEESSNTPYRSVNTHMEKAISLYSDRKKPDYENAIKEAISAVEALCCTLNGKNTTLTDALEKLELKGINIHPAQKEAFKKLYGYTSDEKGIRHGGIDFKNAPSEDAKYMLVVCSAFINYLLEKMSKTNAN